ncbi:hypothetical protein HPB47_003768, partial [Ixodes persulcatus]
MSFLQTREEHFRQSQLLHPTPADCGPQQCHGCSAGEEISCPAGGDRVPVSP